MPLHTHAPESTHSYSLRQRLDVVFGVLLICLAVGGSMALELTQRQRRDAILLSALHEQEQLVYELMAQAAPADIIKVDLAAPSADVGLNPNEVAVLGAVTTTLGNP